MGRSDDYIEDANQELEDVYDEPMDIGEYVDHIFEHPTNASQSTKYLLEAIESEGKRTVIEEGEEKERYRFFDDPNNDGEHAIYGNTEVLNEFVDDLRSIVSGRGKEEKIIWIDGPTATGKSELKRLLVNGLREYSQTEDGKRYTMEWNVTRQSEDAARGFDGGGNVSEDSGDWYRSPVQGHPLSVFPEEVQAEIVEDLNDELVEDGDPIRFDVPEDLDPFSQAAYDELEDHYRAESDDGELFEQVTDDDHLRVVNYLVDEGQGIGILNAEEDGKPMEKLAARFMPRVNADIGSQGSVDARAFNYNGVLSQGNGLMTIIEDADKHTDILPKLMNVPEEDKINIDKDIAMPLDTLMVMISNPNLDKKLNKDQEQQSYDDLRALRRRLEKHEFNYLTNHSLENELIRSELNEGDAVWGADDYDEIEENIRSPLTLNVRDDDGEVQEKEIGPHAVDAAAMYDVVSRLNNDIQGMDLIEKARFFDQGYLVQSGTRKEMEDLEDEGRLPDTLNDGTEGIPVTYTRDVISKILRSDKGRSGEYEDVVMPQDIIEGIAEHLTDEEQFSSVRQQVETEDGDRAVPSEVEHYQALRDQVTGYVLEKQADDVLEAAMADIEIEQSTVDRYIDHVMAWDSGEDTVETQGREEDVNPTFMKQFETEFLGEFEDSQYGRGSRPNEAVEQFREEDIVLGVASGATDEAADGEFGIEALDALIGEYDWDDIERFHADPDQSFDPAEWSDASTDTLTGELREETIENMQTLFDYSQESAELTANKVMNHVAEGDL